MQGKSEAYTGTWQACYLTKQVNIGVMGWHGPIEHPKPLSRKIV